MTYMEWWLLSFALVMLFIALGAALLLWWHE